MMMIDNNIDIDISDWCCYLRPAPRGISIETHYTIQQVLEAVRRQRWYPHYCYYCYSCPLRDVDAWENHVIRHHPDKLTYPGSAPATTVKILEIIEDRELREV